MKRTLLLLLVAVVATSGCASIGEARPEQDLLRFLQAMERQPRQFSYEERFKGQTAQVTGAIEDDFRWSATLSIDGAEVLEQVVSDDALAVRVISQAMVPSLATNTSVNPNVMNALQSGQWVLDYAGAPPLIAPSTKAGSLVTGENSVLDAVYMVQYVRRAITEGASVRVFNPDALDYRPIDDPFERPNKELGIERYDLVPPPLPRRSERGTEQGQPGTLHFRKMSFYVRAHRVIKIVENIDIEGHPDFRRAREGRGPQFPLQILETVRAGKTREPILVRSLSYEITFLEEKARIELPIANVLTASLGELFGPRGLGITTRQGGQGAEPEEPGLPASEGSPPSAPAGS